MRDIGRSNRVGVRGRVEVMLAFSQDVFLFLFFFQKKKCLLDHGPLGAADWLILVPWVLKPGWFSSMHSYLLKCIESKCHIWCYTYTSGGQSAVDY